MKKSLIALAALSAFATATQAQSSVTVYGILDIGYSDAEIKTSRANGTVQNVSRTSTGNGDGGLSTSRLGFKGTEDLGGGNKANFVLEYDLVNIGTGGTGSQAVTATGQSVDGFGARYSWVGLESKDMGQIRLGRQESSAHSVVVAGSAGGANNVAGAMYSGNQTPDMLNSVGARPHAVFVDRAVTYISPKFNNFTAEIQTAQLKDKTEDTGAATISTKGTTNGASLKYSAGKLALAYGYQEAKLQEAGIANGADDKTTAHMFSGSYDLGMVKLFALHAEVKVKNNDVQPFAVAEDRKDATTEIGVQVPMGKTLLWASMFDGDRKTNTNPAAPTTVDTSGYQFGARYDLSKRTNLYAIYGTQKRQNTGLVVGKTEATGMALGVRHSF